MSLAKRFDPKKDFGTVTGDGRFAYDQGGQLYNALKEAVDADGKKMEMEPEKAPAAMPDSAPKVTTGRQIDPEDETSDDKPFDLVAWRQGTNPSPWALVVAEMQKTFGKIVGSKKEAYALIDERYGAPAAGESAQAEASEA